VSTRDSIVKNHKDIKSKLVSAESIDSKSPADRFLYISLRLGSCPTTDRPTAEELFWLTHKLPLINNIMLMPTLKQLNLQSWISSFHTIMLP